jgi:hypothetical protein
MVWKGLMRASVIRILVLGSLFGGTPAGGFAGQSQSTDPQAIRAEIDRLRQEVDSLRQQYGDRLSALEMRLAAIEGSAAPLATAQPPQTLSPAIGPVAPVPPGAASAGGPQGALPIYGNVNLLSKIFNPDVAVVGDVLGAAGNNPVEPLPALDLREAETSFQAIVDPYARADFFFAVSPEGIEIEEGYITFPTLPGGLLMKAGKLRSAFGKVNTMHNHVLPWADRPLVTQNLLGGDEGIADAGVSFARLIPNPWVFLEATGEVYRGESAVFQTHERGDLGYVGHLRGYQDITESSNFDFGASLAYGHNDAGPSATTRIVGLDATFRYRPLRRAIYRRLLARSELAWSRRSESDDLDAFGFYLAADYQFARRWFAGLRFDHSGRAIDPAAKDKGMSWLVTYWPSEFSQIRGQYRRTHYAEGQTANEILFQLLFSIGAHGAHVF